MQDRGKLFNDVRKTLENNVIFFPLLAAFEAVAKLPWEKLSDDGWGTVHHNIRNWIIVPQMQNQMDISSHAERTAVKDAGLNLLAAATFLMEELVANNGDSSDIVAAKKAADSVNLWLGVAMRM